jgi:hypothetical protein
MDFTALLAAVHGQEPLAGQSKAETVARSVIVRFEETGAVIADPDMKSALLMLRDDTNLPGG